MRRFRFRRAMKPVRVMMIVLAAALPMPGLAWSQLGHALVGDLANQQITVATRRQVQELLAGESDPTLGGVASWADALRYSDPARFRATSTWHYINAKGGGCAFDVRRDCAGGRCIVEAVLAQQRILEDRSQPLAARRDALKFLVHLIGDLHQPLHATPRTDSGGNRFQVSLRTAIAAEDPALGNDRNGVVGTNLHVVWDFYVLASAGRDRQEYNARLSALALRPPAKPAKAAPLEWARESCALVEKHRLYPAKHALDQAYLETHRPLAEELVQQAGARLAAVLNAALGEETKP